MSISARPTLVHTLVAHAASRGDRQAYEYLHDDGRVDTITYRELLDRAARVAPSLRTGDGPAGPVLLLYPPGLDFVVAVWACFIAGAPAVPAYPPIFGSTDRIADRFTRILDDSRATTILADPMVLDLLTPGLRAESLPPVVTLASAGKEGGGPIVPPDAADPEALLATLPAATDTALIQYTSGSTGQPKGVLLTHRNLLANITAISQVFELDEMARVVSWLPPYHDMGLIGFILTPVHGGFPVRLMSPVHFLKNPLAWLRQIGELGVTHTGGPNFAYDLCERRAGNVDLSDLDLSTWRLAFNGAEPIRPATMSRFARRFAPHGFRAEAFLPCYGLAEATLIVAGRHWRGHDDIGPDDRVDCGPVIDGHELVLVEPATGGPVPEGTEGEIWVSGPSISGGYWNAGETSDSEHFGHLGGTRYLRTGDLGRLADGRLTVTGRRKEVLIQNGVNHHAHDLCAAAVENNPAVRPTAAAFSGEDEEIILAVEVAPSGHASARLAADLRARVLNATGARVETVVLCPPRTIPRTTSGKIQHSLARHRYLAGELAGQPVPVASPEATEEEAGLITSFFSSIFAAVCKVPSCGPDDTLSAIGGDSLRAAEIAAVAEDALTLPVPVEEVLRAQSPRELTARLSRRWSEDGVGPTDAAARVKNLLPQPRG
ncbi:AMP-binding protein [Streptomyces alkaliphilus]|uniref:AMP-binding protein n=1 Tax=Streptomyces alkaliphilus TaxID=1472722 RepID=A0A7W3T991_9ACTN|nr:AMP-binding protein [Streptomyces alkaliphilus]MBB0242566.1 AMP-binding protein [Streptomyces alkaliphilus]